MKLRLICDSDIVVSIATRYVSDDTDFEPVWGESFHTH